MSVTICPAQEADFKDIQEIFASARQFMRTSGNQGQWEDGYPGSELIHRDIELGQCYVMRQGTELVGTFALIFGDDPTYAVIEDGKWRANLPYATLHRLASNGRVRGLARICFDYCKTRNHYLRVDTHKDNQVMLAAILANGFKRCGIIEIQRGGKREAFDYLDSLDEPVQ